MNPRHRRHSSDISGCNCCLMKAKISIQLYTYLTHTHTRLFYTRARACIEKSSFRICFEYAIFSQQSYCGTLYVKLLLLMMLIPAP